MYKDIIKVFEINTDAIATNRGFYYQYLKVLKKWVNNYIEGNQLVTFNEVEDDIKEIGNELVFTQVKCYSSSFSFKSVEIKKSLFNFFILYLKYKNEKENITFCFSTNTNVSKREKLLLKWVDDKGFVDKNILNLCCSRVKDILIKEIKQKKNKLLERQTSIEEKNNIKNISNSFKETLNDDSLINFLKRISWEFDNINPEKAIDELTTEIVNLLKHEKFKPHSPKLLFSCFISEIYKNSQNEKINERALDSKLIISIINGTEKELESTINKKLTSLLNFDLQVLKADVINMRIDIERNADDIHILKGNIENTKEKLPRNLNFLPDYQYLDIYGWDVFLEEVNSTLNKKKLFSVYSEGGMGKTTFGKKFLQKEYNNYDHIVWINAETSIASAFLLDDILRRNLNITTLDTEQKTNLVNKKIINELNKIDGKNLIVLDIQESKNEIAELKSISLSPNWSKLILTRSKITTIPHKKLPRLSFNDAKNIYVSHCFSEDIDLKILNAFFELIEYNVLVIELVAKTVHNGINLSLKNFIDSIKNQQLDKSDFEIDIEVGERSESIKIFNYLLEKFSFESLSNEEKNYLNYLSILPSNKMTIEIEELIAINGSEFYNENKIYIINILNSLSKKGLISLSKDRKHLSIHKIIQEVLIYRERCTKNPFISNIFYINWLSARIKESNNTPQSSLKYLKYAESILNSIKEKYRGSIYQPLLLLENEYFHAIRFYIGERNELSRLIDLTNRAENYLANEDLVLLGIIYNNLALCYADNDNLESAKVYFKKAINCFNGIEKEEVLIIKITSMNNLSSVFLKEYDVINAMKIFKKKQSIRKKYSLFEDQQIGIEFKILSIAYSITKDTDNAIINILGAINYHKSFEEVDRNDFYLAMYFNELAVLYLEKEIISQAITCQEECVKILEGMDFYSSKYLLDMYQVLKSFYQYNDDENEKSMCLEQKINNFKIIK